MGRLFLLCAGILFLTLNANGQVEVSHDKIPAPPEGQLRSLHHDSTAAWKNRMTDSLSQIGKRSTGELVYSEKQWKHFRDSLSRIPDVNIPQIPENLSPKKEVMEEELVQAVNRKFFSVADSMQGKTPGEADVLQKLHEKEGYAGSLTDDLPAVKTPDIDKLQLPANSLQDLSPLSGRIMDSKYLKSLDSVRKVNLKTEGLKLKEKKTSLQGKLSLVREKPRFLDRSYFEGVVGIQGGDFTILQLTPAFGYHFTDYLSAGLGPNILIREESKTLKSSLGIKSFFKVELLKRQAYLQIEDVMDSYMSGDTGERKRIFDQHNVFAGAGYLLSFSRPFTLNLSVLYRINDDAFVLNEFSPWVFRIGISTIKIKDR